ncbi:hypothetical protein NUW58_g5246 [Xylaria curta]|uniref:Uncharacterized protein n=1 Tax=Xylaria curta TaxID=42375 RepID=A0ACC1P575_9PEZI|nr:hypothetical protein NUW58_g5246 [Xylaria curta]
MYSTMKTLAFGLLATGAMAQSSSSALSSSAASSSSAAAEAHSSSSTGSVALKSAGSMAAASYPYKQHLLVRRQHAYVVLVYDHPSYELCEPYDCCAGLVVLQCHGYFGDGCEGAHDAVQGGDYAYL